jgi:hypothetical protein
MRKLGRMRESSSNPFAASDPRSGSTHNANPLFQNILAVSPCGSRFWPDIPLPRARKPLAMSILRTTPKKNLAELSSSRTNPTPKVFHRIVVRSLGYPPAIPKPNA